MTEVNKRPKIESSFFDSSSPPSDLSTVEQKLADFVKNLPSSVSHVILLTSGGTTVPLEKNTVRFIDNFSTGARGAAMCEEFLKLGCAVVFLQRIGSVSPFTQGFGNKQFLDLTVLSQISKQNGVGDRILEDARSFQRYVDDNLFLSMTFWSVSDYLFKLRSAARALNSSKLMIVLAAAVSDFYIPETQMEEHKIQSSGGSLDLHLGPVPKLLSDLKHIWAPDGYCVSFKLETDHKILIQKAEGAIEKYGVDLVVANELHSRYKQVILVKASSVGTVLQEINKPEDSIIEVPLVAKLLEHKAARHHKDEL